MKRSDLKTGMIVKTRNGNTGLIVKDNSFKVDAVIFSEKNWTALNNYTDDLIWLFNYQTIENRSEHAKGVDIMEVYIPDLPTGFLSRTNKFSGWTPVWKRPVETPSYTLSELREIIGHDFRLKL